MPSPTPPSFSLGPIVVDATAPRSIVNNSALFHTWTALHCTGSVHISWGEQKKRPISLKDVVFDATASTSVLSLRQLLENDFRLNTSDRQLELWLPGSHGDRAGTCEMTDSGILAPLRFVPPPTPILDALVAVPAKPNPSRARRSQKRTRRPAPHGRAHPRLCQEPGSVIYACGMANSHRWPEGLTQYGTHFRLGRRCFRCLSGGHLARGCPTLHMPMPRAAARAAKVAELGRYGIKVDPVLVTGFIGTYKDTVGFFNIFNPLLVDRTVYMASYRCDPPNVDPADIFGQCKGGQWGNVEPLPQRPLEPTPFAPSKQKAVPSQGAPSAKLPVPPTSRAPLSLLHGPPPPRLDPSHRRPHKPPSPPPGRLYAMSAPIRPQPGDEDFTCGIDSDDY